MKRLFIALALLLGALVGAPHAAAQTQDTTVWDNWGAAPYARSFAEATSDAKFDFALKELEVPEEIRGQFKELVRANPNGATEYLDPGDRVNGMMTGGKNPHAMKNVEVARIVVMQGVVRAAEVRVWRITYQGRIYELILPLRCFNWSIRIVTPPPSEERCVELTFRIPLDARDPWVRWGAGSKQGPLPPSGCNAQRQGNGAWDAWYGECDECVPNYGYISRTLGGNATVPHRYKYQATAREQTIRFSTSVWSRTVYVCLEFTRNGRVVHTCGVYVLPNRGNGAWNERYTVDIADVLWVESDGNCPR